jgi:hypothetical protein
MPCNRRPGAQLKNVSTSSISVNRSHGRLIHCSAVNGVSSLRFAYNGWGDDAIACVAAGLRDETTMDQVEKFLELYRQTTTSSERRVLLEAVRISSPQELSRLEERILREHVRGMTVEQLIHTIAAHRGLALQQAGDSLRDAAFQHLLDRSKLKALVSPETESSSTVTPAQSVPPMSQPSECDRGAAEAEVLSDGPQGEASPNPAGRISRQQNDSLRSNAPGSAGTPLPRLTPRGIGG